MKEELYNLKKNGLLRQLERLDGGSFPYISLNGKRYINFCSNNYLALNGHPVIVDAMKRAIGCFGTSSGSSRLIAGNLELFERAEAKLAVFKKREDALIFPSGFQANVTVLATLAREDDEIFSDALNHASIVDGCRLSKAKISVYKHKDMNNLESLLRNAKGKRKIIVTDGVFSMDGDIAPLKDICWLAKRYDGVVIVDDAHATGVLGDDGRGTLEYFGIEDENIMVLGTGGKALGVGGAFFCCAKVVKEYLVNKGRGFIYTTAPIPAIPAGLIASIDVISSEPERRKKLFNLSTYFYDQLKTLGFNVGSSPSHIIPVVVGDNEKVIKLAEKLKKEGIFVKAIRTPTVPKGTERLRFSLTSEHTKDDIDKAINVLRTININ